MRFLIDECTGPAVADWLRDRGYDAFSIYDQSRGLDDDAILEKALLENRILITNDKDFGEKIFRDNALHKGVILLRLEDERANRKITAIQRLIETYPTQLEDNFTVVTEDKVRISRKK